MRRLMLFACIVSLAACAPTHPPDLGNNATSPTSNSTAAADPACPGNAVSNATRLDERLALGVEATYMAARTAVELGVDSGVVKGAVATRLRTANRTAYDGVKDVRAAYCAGNQASYMSAAVKATEAISAYLAASRGDK